MREGKDHCFILVLHLVTNLLCFSWVLHLVKYVFCFAWALYLTRLYVMQIDQKWKSLALQMAPSDIKLALTMKVDTFLS